VAAIVFRMVLLRCCTYWFKYFYYGPEALLWGVSSSPVRRLLGMLIFVSIEIGFAV
jgi:hypothetical protein